MDEGTSISLELLAPALRYPPMPGSAMVPRTITMAMDTAQAVFDERRGTQLHRAIREFVRVLRTVPDCAPAEISAGAIQVIRHLAERVVDRIERRLASGEDRPSLQQELATAVYDLRTALEEIDHWTGTMPDDDDRRTGRPS